MGTVRIEDAFFGRYRNLVRTKMLPYQWQVLNDREDIAIERERDDASIPNEKSHGIMNFKIAAGLEKGHHYGWVFQDSDVYKWLEAVAFSLQSQPDGDLESLADQVVDLIGKAQEPDGYLGTYFTIDAPDRKFACLMESHELYCAGHFMEAAVAYYDAVHKKKALEMACRLADCIDRHFGPEEGKIHGYDGHEEVEIGLDKLYRATGEKRYLQLALFFLEERGKDPDFLYRQKREEHKPDLIKGMSQLKPSYFQVHAPAIEQTTAEGHAVRLVYLCTAMARVAKETGDGQMEKACRKIWKNIVERRMYITGGIGSTVHGEAFTLDDDLPKDTMYCETCASVGLIFFAQAMLQLESKGEYGDVMERALYNTALAGMALDGTHFFYVNPLEVNPEKSRKDPGKSHVKVVRPPWLACACCPPNLARLLASLDRYIYIRREEELLVNLFVGSRGSFICCNEAWAITQTGNYPWEGEVELHLEGPTEGTLPLGIRLPGWCRAWKVLHNGKEETLAPRDGFLYPASCRNGDQIKLIFAMKPERWYAHPKVSSTFGQTAIARGPLVYCLEEVDNGGDLHLLELERYVPLSYSYRLDLLGGVGIIQGKGWRTLLPERAGLYEAAGEKRARKEQMLQWIPYFAWANRGENAMQVWIKETDEITTACIDGH